MNRSYFAAVATLMTLIISGGLIYFGVQPHFKEGEKVLSEVITPPVTETASPLASSSVQLQNSVQVVRVIDGDTIEVNLQGKNTKVRLIGVDTPETVDPRRGVQCFGKEASNQTKSLVDQKRVILTKDVSETDKFGRLLRYVYLPLEDGQLLFLNDYLVREGFAHASTYPPDVAFSAQFTEAERAARLGKKGLWQSCSI